MSTKRKKTKGTNQKIWLALNKANKTPGPWDPSVVLVMPKQCDNCLLGPDKLVTDRRRDEILEKTPIEVFQCHLSTIAGQPRCCYQWFHRGRSLVARMAKENGWWKYQGIHEKEPI